jgi:hypothetical protein
MTTDAGGAGAVHLLFVGHGCRPARFEPAEKRRSADYAAHSKPWRKFHCAVQPPPKKGRSKIKRKIKSKKSSQAASNLE